MIFGAVGRGKIPVATLQPQCGTYISTIAIPELRICSIGKLGRGICVGTGKRITVNTTDAVYSLQPYTVAGFHGPAAVFVGGIAVGVRCNRLVADLRDSNAVNYHVLVYSRNTIHYVERFGMDDFAKEYVENALKHIDAILSSGEFMYRKLRAEFVAQERAIRELKKHNAPNREVAAMS